MSEGSQSPDTLVSRHIFLFPFKWENKVKGKDRKETLFTERTNLKVFHQSVLAHQNQQKISWENVSFSLDHLNHYNEFNYYYDFVREILYQLEPGQLHVGESGGSLLKHYECRFQKKAPDYEYVINVNQKENHKNKTYTLQGDSITLDVYETGVAILAFFLKNHQYSEPNDILQINQFGRRIFPPFFDLKNDEVGANFDYGNSRNDFYVALWRTQKRELAAGISLNFKGRIQAENLTLSEDFQAHGEKGNFQKGPFRLPEFIYKLFPDEVISTQEAKFDPGTPSKDQNRTDSILIRPVLDDRMFVLCWYGGRKKLERLSIDTIRDNNPYFRITSPEGEFWYKYIFVDSNGPSVFDYGEGNKQLDEVTYKRWMPYTYYGITRYSMVSLTEDLPTLKKYDAAFIVQHFESIYFKLFSLAIIQRASVLRFSDEVTHISHFPNENGAYQKDYGLLKDQVRDLNENYLRFINKIYFREVTPQEQGIEIYDMMQTQMRIEGQVKDLDSEIQELHRYVKLREQEEIEKVEERRTTMFNALTILGALFLIPSFILGLYELSAYASFFIKNQGANTALWITALMILLGISSIGAFSRRHWAFRWIGRVGAVGLLLLLLLGPLESKTWQPINKAFQSIISFKPMLLLTKNKPKTVQPNMASQPDSSDSLGNDSSWQTAPLPQDNNNSIIDNQ